MYDPPPANTAVTATVINLVAAAREGKLVVCVGAGLSVAEDACLPSGRRVGVLLNQRLDGQLRGYVAPEKPENLIAVADAAVVPIGGEEALRNEVLKVARFTRAIPNHGHQALGLLLAEGALTVLTWNWDTCIERTLPQDEELRIARTSSDMADIRLPQLAKIHGCAHMPPSLLVTSDHLASPPLWTDSVMEEHLRTSLVVFVGVGDVADYTQKRIAQLVDELRAPDVRVVSRNAVSDWDGSKWKEVMPTLADDEDRRIEAAADVFLDQLARAWAMELVRQVKADAENLSPQNRGGVESVAQALGSLSAVTLIRWCREAVLRSESGTSAVHLPQVGDAVVAAGVLAGAGGDTVEAPRPGCCRIGDATVDLLALGERTPASDVRREGLRRAQQLKSRGVSTDRAPRFVVAGTVIGPLRDATESPPDVFGGDEEPTDVKDGPLVTAPRFVLATDILAEAA